MPLPDDLFSAPFPEPSQSFGFAGNRLVRDSENRDETSLQKALDNPASRFFLHSGASVLVEKGDAPRAAFSIEEARGRGADPAASVLLGTAPDGAPQLSVAAPIDAEALQEPFHLYDHRALLYASSVSEAEVGAIAQGAALLAFLANHRFCGKCGAPTRTEIGGYRIACTRCGHLVFPRTDPVVIMLSVVRDPAGDRESDKCLLGRSPHFPEGWYSTLAGFVEPGETIEDAVRRETFEEAAIRVRRVRYYGSQPWPFPHSLMIGVHCEAESQDIRFDGNELEDCRWFSRADVRLMIADTHPEGFKCPPSRAIAHSLIRAWVGD
ncbi:MAG: NAD(+) diphosphatase [Nitratireductor sp.]|nr:NAD(+) diphosphatase [Nitratireductor sp.]